MRESAKTTRNQLKVMRERSMWCCPKCAVSRGSFSERRSRSTLWSTWKAAETCHTCSFPLCLLFRPQTPAVYMLRAAWVGLSCTRDGVCVCACACGGCSGIIMAPSTGEIPRRINRFWHMPLRR